MAVPNSSLGLTGVSQRETEVESFSTEDLICSWGLGRLRKPMALRGEAERSGPEAEQGVRAVEISYEISSSGMQRMTPEPRERNGQGSIQREGS